jgi:hypothetical protein
VIGFEFAFGAGVVVDVVFAGFEPDLAWNFAFEEELMWGRGILQKGTG